MKSAVKMKRGKAVNTKSARQMRIRNWEKNHPGRLSCERSLGDLQRLAKTKKQVVLKALTFA